MDELVIDRTPGMGRQLAVRWLEQHPEVAARMREVGARVVVVEPKYGPLFENTQEALDRAEVPAEVRPIFVALTGVTAVVETGAFELRNQGCELVRMKAPSFLGYIAIGEGGVAFFDEGGKWRVPDAETVLRLL